MSDAGSRVHKLMRCHKRASWIENYGTALQFLPFVCHFVLYDLRASETIKARREGNSFLGSFGMIFVYFELTVEERKEKKKAS